MTSAITFDIMKELYRDAYNNTDNLYTGRASGRVNLIGGHTDYNDGYVLPIPLDRDIWIVGSPRNDDTVNAYAADFDEWATFSLKDVTSKDTAQWVNYIQGVAWSLHKRGYILRGVDLVIKGTVPIGAGLSSSAAIEVAALRLFSKISGFTVEPVEAAYICMEAENDYVGVKCGVMDQFVASLGRRGNALFIDCRTNDFELLSLPPDVRVVIVNSNVKRELASSAYNERRAQCMEGVKILEQYLPGIRALRDVSVSDLNEFGHNLPPLIYRRCHHVVTENARVLEGVRALQAEDMMKLGELINASHASLRDDYEVSSGELNILVETAQSLPQTLGSRMTGAGFGGCTVNLVKANSVLDFTRKISEGYFEATGLSAEIYPV